MQIDQKENGRIISGPGTPGFFLGRLEERRGLESLTEMPPPEANDHRKCGEFEIYVVIGRRRKENNFFFFSIHTEAVNKIYIQRKFQGCSAPSKMIEVYWVSASALNQRS